MLNIFTKSDTRRLVQYYVIKNILKIICAIYTNIYLILFHIRRSFMHVTACTMCNKDNFTNIVSSGYTCKHKNLGRCSLLLLHCKRLKTCYFWTQNGRVPKVIFLPLNTGAC